MHDDLDWSADALADPYRASEDGRKEALRRLIRHSPVLIGILTALRELELPDAWLVSGGLYQNLWNHLTGRPFGYGIKDYDVIYFDGQDLSYEAEDAVIRKVQDRLAHVEAEVEVRNQARVHLWYKQRFGSDYPPLSCATESLCNYASKTHSIAARIVAGDEIEIAAPFGLANAFGLRIVPNYVVPNRRTYEEKGARMMALWPELTIEPWAAPAN